FVDEQGRLRISNRYDNARVFNEGRAPISLRGKWGFIDYEENLIIQPYYENTSQFIKGLAVVHRNGKSGLIDKNGTEVLELIWKSVHRLNTGNYIVQDINGQYGLVNEDGSFILRPAYDHLSDFENQVVVSKRGAWGVLDYSGQQIYKINHEDVKVVGEFTMIKN
ncbi:MAG: WG repeat-containing protein, partial [Ekhidna sp.]